MVPAAVAAAAVCGRDLLSAAEFGPAALANFVLALTVRCFTLAQPAAAILVVAQGLLFVDSEEQGDETCEKREKK